MNVYDFDGTIYPGDSSLKFICFLYQKKPWLLFSKGIKTLLFVCAYVFRIISRERAKEVMFEILLSFDNYLSLVEEFWDRQENNIKPFYLLQRRDDDVIISASPYFLINPISQRLGVTCIASFLDPLTAAFNGKRNCKGSEKVNRFNQQFSDSCIDEFYSDSYSDEPLALKAKKAYYVRGEKITDWIFRDK